MREFPAATMTAPGRARVLGRPLLVFALAAGAAASSSCALNQQGVPPPRDRITYPASALVDPDGRWLYVANSNSDLRYNNGTLVAVDLDAAIADRFGPAGGPAVAPPWKICAGPERVRIDSDPEPCCWEALNPVVLDCDDRLYIPPDSTVEIGSFSSGMIFQPFTEPSCPQDRGGADQTKIAADTARVRSTHANRHDCSATCPGEPVGGRLFVGVRGNSSLTYVDTSRVANPAGGTRPAFTCIKDGVDQHICPVIDMNAETSPGDTGGAPIHVPDEPYALALQVTQDLLYVGHLRGDTAHPQTGGISLFDVSRPTGRDEPRFLGPSSSFFGADGNGNFGITSLTTVGEQVYASSRYTTSAVNIVPTLAAQPNLCTQQGNEIVLVSGQDGYVTPLVGAEIRGIQFLPEGNRAFALQRTPPALVGFDMSRTQQAFGNFPSDVLETCAGPTFLQSYDAGEGTRLYVTCFDAGQIYVFDPYVPRLIAVIEAGRGPAGLAFPPSFRTDRSEKLAYVVGFSANDISVVDVTPGSQTQYRVVQRIGFPSAVPR
jgi:hypothetical protein